MSDGPKNEAPISIIPGHEFVRASERPVMGDRRLVKYLPVPLPGMQGQLRPCIWMSPYVERDTDLGEDVKVCLVLMDKGPPRPDVICVRIPAAAVDKFPEGPVEW